MSSSDVTISSGNTIVFTVPPRTGTIIDVVGVTASIVNFATINTSAQYTWTNTQSFSAISANGTLGTAGQALISNGTSTYWGNAAVSPAGSTTQVQYNDGGFSNASAGFTFTKSTNNVTVANTVNALAFVAGETGMGTGGTIQNTSTIFVGNDTINTFITSAGLRVNNATIANNSGFYTTGTINAASHTVGTSFTANSTVVNAVSFRINTDFIANTTGLYHTGTVNSASINTSSISTATITATGNISIGSAGDLVLNAAAGIFANGTLGTSGQILSSNGSAAYWANAPVSFTTGKAIAMAIVFG
jgi:hypothetical protein